MNLSLTFLIVALAVEAALCFTLEEPNPFEKEYVKHQNVKYVGSKAKTLLKGATSNQQVYQILKDTGNRERIQGRHTALNYRTMCRFAPGSCMKNTLKWHQAACNAAKIASLKEYCGFCMGKLTEYCEKNADSLLEDVYREVFHYRDRETAQSINDAEALSKKIDAFIISTGDESASDKVNVLAWCKNKWFGIKAVDEARTCKIFLGAVNELALYVSNREELISFLSKWLRVPAQKPIERCEILMKKCPAFYSGLAWPNGL